MKTLKIFKNCILTALLLIAFALTWSVSALSVITYAEEKYTNVLDDLNLDKSFDYTKYPNVANDYSISVIQVAESINGELFIYVYQPSNASKDLVATSINISTGINNNLSYKNYKLTLVSTEDVFDKYVVNDFTVLPDSLRYYDISAIYRAYDASIDSDTVANETNEKAFEVAQRWTASTVNGQVSYSMLAQEIVEILNPYVGFIRYSGGFPLMAAEYVESHYIAFSTNYEIDKLMEADLEWVESDYLCNNPNTPYELYTYLNERSNSVRLYSNETVEYTGDGWFAETYEWRRIQTVDEFIKTEDLPDATESTLKDNNLQWVLRFTETEYYEIGNLIEAFRYEGVRVSNVTILRLKFEIDGEVYNLGAISDKVSGDLIPDNNNTDELNFSLGNLLFGSGNDPLSWLTRIVAIVLGVLLLYILIKFVIWLVDTISNADTKRKVNKIHKSVNNKGKKKRKNKGKKKRKK